MTSEHPANGAARGYNGGLPALRRVFRDLREQYATTNERPTPSRPMANHKHDGSDPQSTCGWIADNRCEADADAVIGISDATVDTPTTPVRVCDRHLERAKEIDHLVIEWIARDTEEMG